MRDLVNIMDTPQNNRRPPELDLKEKKQLLRQHHPDDAIDPFVTDPNPGISELGKLALRVSDSDKFDYYIAIGDACANHILKDGRLKIFYVGKSLMAYQRSLELASGGVDKPMVQQAIDALIDWISEAALAFPSQRNAAVALWVMVDDDDDIPSPSITPGSMKQVISSYQTVSVDDSMTLFGDANEEEPATRADILVSDVFSDATRTIEADDYKNVYQSMEVGDDFDILDETRGKSVV